LAVARRLRVHRRAEIRDRLLPAQLNL
jgi:hypothetical protein